MSDRAQRAGILAVTIIFLLTTIGIALYAIIFNNNSNKEDSTVSISCSTDSSINYTPAPPLAGKPLPQFTPTDSIKELSCIDIVEGTGAVVKSGDTVTAHYTGAVASTGTVFQSSYDSGSPIPFSLSGVIAGWSQGVPGMKEGGKRRLLIPSSLAYGENPPAGSGIPANGDLVFDIDLTKVGQ